MDGEEDLHDTVTSSFFEQIDADTKGNSTKKTGKGGAIKRSKRKKASSSSSPRKADTDNDDEEDEDESSGSDP